MLLQEEHDVEQISWVRVGGEHEHGPDFPDVHRFDAEELAGEIDAVKVDLPAGGMRVCKDVAQQLEVRLDLVAAGAFLVQPTPSVSAQPSGFHSSTLSYDGVRQRNTRSSAAQKRSTMRLST